MTSPLNMNTCAARQAFRGIWPALRLRFVWAERKK